MTVNRQDTEAFMRRLQEEAERCGEAALATYLAENREQVATLWLANPRKPATAMPDTDNPFQYTLR